MKLTKFLVLLIIVIWLSVSITYVSYKGYYKERVINEFEMDITITASKFVGLNVDTDAIHFGVVPLGGGSSRRINLTNSKDYDVLVYVEKDDSELSSLVYIDPNYFTLEANENKRVEIGVSVPEDFTPGNYTGKVRVIGKVPFYKR